MIDRCSDFVYQSSIHIFLVADRVGLAKWLACPPLVGRGSWTGHTKDHHKNGTNCHSALHVCVRVGV